MPDFGLDDSDTRALAVYLRGLRTAHRPPDWVVHPDGADGRDRALRIVQERGCRQCHALDGQPPAIARFYADPALAPPSLDVAGARLQPQWLFDYLLDPGPVRPWLDVQMPRFRFAPDEARALTGWLAERSGHVEALRPLGRPFLSPQRAADGERLFAALKCVTCHRLQRSDGQSAADLAPDLGLARQRLDPAWVRRFLQDPGAVLPGTKMPQFFPDGTTPVPDLLCGDAAAQMDLIVDHLMHLHLLPVAAPAAPTEGAAP
jgi:cytochrome c2